MIVYRFLEHGVLYAEVKEWKCYVGVVEFERSPWWDSRGGAKKHQDIAVVLARNPEEARQELQSSGGKTLAVFAVTEAMRVLEKKMQTDSSKKLLITPLKDDPVV